MADFEIIRQAAVECGTLAGQCGSEPVTKETAEIGAASGAAELAPPKAIHSQHALGAFGELGCEIARKATAEVVLGLNHDAVGGEERAKASGAFKPAGGGLAMRTRVHAADSTGKTDYAVTTSTRAA